MAAMNMHSSRDGILPLRTCKHVKLLHNTSDAILAP